MVSNILLTFILNQGIDWGNLRSIKSCKESLFISKWWCRVGLVHFTWMLFFLPSLKTTRHNNIVISESWCLSQESAKASCFDCKFQWQILHVFLESSSRISFKYHLNPTFLWRISHSPFCQCRRFCILKIKGEIFKIFDNLWIGFEVHIHWNVCW